MDDQNLTPSVIKEELDRYVIGQDEAKKAVEAVHYPPEGRRGVGLARAQGYGTNLESYMKWLKDESIIIVQIEDIRAVDNLEEIFSVSNIDGYIIGPYDLSASMGIPGEFDNPKFIDVLNKIASYGSFGIFE